MKKEAGFTLLEVIIAFAIFLIVTSVVPHYLKLISFDPKFNQRIETSIFFQQLAFDIQESARISVVNNTLYLQKENNKTVTYALFQHRIRRQVNHVGQEIVLQNVQKIQFSEWGNGIDVRVQDSFDQEHQKRITHLLPLEDMYDEQ